MTDVHLNFRYSESDYVRAYQAHQATKKRLILDAIIVTIVTMMGVYRLWNANDSKHDFWMGIGMISTAAFALLMFVTAYFIMPHYIFRTEPKFRDDYSINFSDDGIHFRTAHLDSNLQWGVYNRALITSHSYMLYYGKRHFTIVPKRFFESAEQQKKFETLIRNHILDIKTR